MKSSEQARNWEHKPDVFGGIEDISEALVIREQGAFLLTDDQGNVPPDNDRGFGLYSGDTRHLSGYQFLLDGARPVFLLSTAESGFSLQQVIGNHRMEADDGTQVGRCTIELARQLVLGDGLQEDLRITNFNPFPVTVQPCYEFAADFADIFEIRGHTRQAFGSLLTPELNEGGITYRYLGADGRMRFTRIGFEPPPAQLSESMVRYVVTVGPRESVTIRLHIQMDGQVSPEKEPATRRIAQSYNRWRQSFTRIYTNNEIFNRVLDRSVSDLRMLWREEPGGRRFFAAGTPWFDALFGRDSMIVALQTLSLRPTLALDCLRIMARYQGQNHDEFRAEEPGKILHELRDDELCAIGELPYERYYGSVDSTPLFLLLAAEYYNWTNDITSLEELRPAILAALHWVHQQTAKSRDGFVEYETDSSTGLRNQGWKDSDDCICHADGTPLDGPIALPEVQGYTYAAFRLLPRLLDRLGENREAARLREEARRLRRSFERVFWLEDERIVPLGRDGEGRPAAVMSSNVGQALWSGILDAERATAVRDALMDNDMFTGWGIRTLARSAAAYNPNGYHVGTLWPHDNAIIVAGLKRYGFYGEVNELATSLFDAATSFQSYRLPEVFGGQPRSPHQPPVPYPVACRPQAWAAGAMLQVLQAVLGLVADGPNRRLYIVQPELPHWLDNLYLAGVKVGYGSVDLGFRRDQGRTSVQVHEARDVEVVQTSRWPSLSRA